MQSRVHPNNELVHDSDFFIFLPPRLFWSLPLSPGLSVLESISATLTCLPCTSSSTVLYGGVSPAALRHLRINMYGTPPSVRLFQYCSSLSPMSAVVSANLISISGPLPLPRLWYRRHGTLRGASQPRSINTLYPVHTSTLYRLPMSFKRACGDNNRSDRPARCPNRV